MDTIDEVEVKHSCIACDTKLDSGVMRIIPLTARIVMLPI